MNYPHTDTTAIADTLFGKIISDPYRWLEDDRSEKTKAWIEDQNKLTFSYLDKIPYRDQLKKRMSEIWNYERFTAPFHEGKYTYFFKNDGLQNQSVLYRQTDNGEPEIFLDPNTFSPDGTTSLGGIDFSKDGSLVAYQISEGGSDWRKVIVLDAETKKVVDDTLKDVKFSGLSWKGNEGFYYSSYDKPINASQLSAKTDQHKLFFHQLGAKQSEDALIFGGSKTPRRYIGGGVTEDEQYLVISAATSTNGNELYIQDLRTKNAPIQTIVKNFDHNNNLIHTEGSTLYILTDLDAPNMRLVKTDIKQVTPEHWVDVIAETNMPLSISTGGGKLFASYLKDATSQMLQYNLNGQLEHEIKLPGKGTADGIGGKWDETKLYYSYTSYISPSTIYSYEVASGQSSIYKKSGIKFDPSGYESNQVFYTSKDGTKIPMIITHKKGLKMDGQNPTILYGYGGFDISLTPTFSTAMVAWLEVGGVYAVPNIRGGGEYGKAWHDAGTKMQKQNVFDDFIAAAEWLINQHYTSSSYLAISGGSNGGLLVGACMTQRPELYKVALPAVGVLDMLRYHKFTAGAGWAYDYGTADDSLEMLNYLLTYSPYHNLHRGKNYPATMVTTGDHDDRVVPAHSFKFAARLQANNDGPNPTLIRIETKAGHGAGKPTAMVIAEYADRFAFALYNMGIKNIEK
ncbi:MAG: prolyl oligopeptidase family serine peptidase [bacterium]|nr:prolyl oligopeptidase family serine peptidase [bacterium]